MIKAKTVFVLGAGASEPYGFPLGRALVESIYSDLDEKGASVLRRLLHEAGFKSDEIKRFRDELGDAGRASIDAFLERRPEYLKLGKVCIAATLLPLEREDELDPIRKDGPVEDRDRRARRWYHYLFDQMLSRGDFQDNQLSIITFNFDRSFERALFRTLKAGLSRSGSDVRELCAGFPILHIHGSLGDCQWLTPECEPSRAYGASPVTLDDVIACARQIRLVMEEIPPEVIQRAAGMLSAATHVCFLGFSYHHQNLQKLKHEQTIVQANKSTEGTAYLMPTGPRTRAMSEFRPKGRSQSMLSLRDPKWDVLTFLQETKFIHQ